MQTSEHKSIQEWLSLFSTGFPKNHDEQALAALHFFPNNFFGEFDGGALTLTSIQETYLFGLISMQGLLMGDHYHIKEPKLCSFAKQCIDAMAKSWVLSYGSIYCEAMKIGRTSGSTDNHEVIDREEILQETFSSACQALIGKVPDPLLRARIIKAIIFMKKNNVGLHGLPEVDIEKSTLAGIMMLRVLAKNVDGRSAGACSRT